VYQIGFPGQKPLQRTRISGSGFLVADGLIATNRHVAEPWYGDPDSDELLDRGASATLEKLLAYFPGSREPVNLKAAALSSDGDVALVRAMSGTAGLEPLPLASNKPQPGELVAVVGYPMGVLGMMAKAPSPVYARLAYRHDDQANAGELAALSLIRPSATCGHLGDVVGDKLIYDAPTAHGASGGPVFNSRGEVIGVNAAYIDGFSGGTLGVWAESLRPLVKEALRPRF
jgi:S1-C subfamily serine protease